MSDQFTSAYPKPGKPPKKMMDDGDDTTRKVASGAGISFTPISVSSFVHPQSTSFSSSYDMASLQSTQPLKARAQASVNKPAQLSPKTFRWVLNDVPTLPEFHPLERTAVFVENSSPSEVSERISDVLRKRSIEATYEDDKAKVRCMTSSGVDFRIRLYRGRSQYSKGIIVEVQRRFGHAVDFYNHTNAILDSAQGLPSTPSPPPPPTSLSSGNSLPLVSDSEDDYVAPSGASSLKMITLMFRHSDTHYLAFQTLASLTDASKMGANTAANVSEELLKIDNEVGSRIVDLIVSEKDDDGFNLRLMALTVLANALSATEGQISDVLRERIRPALLKELERTSASNLLASQQAARCLEFIWKGDHDVGELQVALETAKAVGEARHAGLEKQAQKTLSKMVDYC